MTADAGRPGAARRDGGRPGAERSDGGRPGAERSDSGRTEGLRANGGPVDGEAVDREPVDGGKSGPMAANPDFPSGTDTEELGDVLVQLSFAVQLILGRAATEHGLSVTQIRLLGILRDREPTMAGLARFLALDKSSITGLVDRAERRGLVRRSAAPQDGRSVQVAITRHGREVFDAFALDAGRGIRALTDDFTEAESDHLSTLARRIVRKDAATRNVGGLT